jgi:hypothetical protein
MLRVLRHPRMPAPRAQEIIRPRRPVTTHNVDHTLRPSQPRHQIMQQVELPRIIGLLILRPAIAQEVIQLLHRPRNVGIPNAIHHIQRLARVQMMQFQLIFRAILRHLGHIHRQHPRCQQRSMSQRNRRPQPGPRTDPWTARRHRLASKHQQPQRNPHPNPPARR